MLNLTKVLLCMIFILLLIPISLSEKCQACICFTGLFGNKWCDWDDPYYGYAGVTKFAWNVLSTDACEVDTGGSSCSGSCPCGGSYNDVCTMGRCPTSSSSECSRGCSDGATCKVSDDDGTKSYECTGVWDSWESKCVGCDQYHREIKIYGDNSSADYCHRNDGTGISGDWQCESACGANPKCDEKSISDQCDSQTFDDYCDGRYLVDYDGDCRADSITVYSYCDIYCDCPTPSATPTKHCCPGLCGANCDENSDCNDKNRCTSDKCSDCQCTHSNKANGCYSNQYYCYNGEEKSSDFSSSACSCLSSGYWDDTKKCCDSGDYWCAGDNTWYCSDGRNITDPDYSKGACSCLGTGYWNIGGEVDATTCCGDDSNQYRRSCTRTVNEPGSNVCEVSNDDEACCDKITDCVYEDECYSPGTFQDVDGDGFKEYCTDTGKWGRAPDGTEGCNYGIECESGICYYYNHTCLSLCPPPTLSYESSLTKLNLKNIIALGDYYNLKEKPFNIFISLPKSLSLKPFNFFITFLSFL